MKQVFDFTQINGGLQTQDRRWMKDKIYPPLGVAESFNSTLKTQNSKCSVEKL